MKTKHLKYSRKYYTFGRKKYHKYAGIAIINNYNNIVDMHFKGEL